MPVPLYVLDTGILLALLRGKQLGQYIDTTFQLRHQPNKPLICAVTKGEIGSLARQFGWQAAKRQALALLLQNDVVSVDIDLPAILDAYEEIDWVSLKQPGGTKTWVRMISGSQPRPRPLGQPC